VLDLGECASAAIAPTVRLSGLYGALGPIGCNASDETAPVAYRRTLSLHQPSSVSGVEIFDVVLGVVVEELGGCGAQRIGSALFGRLVLADPDAEDVLPRP
jgi:hypothetical protein